MDAAEEVHAAAPAPSSSPPVGVPLADEWPATELAAAASDGPLSEALPHVENIAPTPVRRGRLLRDSQVELLLSDLQLTTRAPSTTPQRGVFATRSLDMREIACIGYDMDYTLIDYKMVFWEERAYHYSKERLRSRGFPVSGLRFNAELVTRGIIVDKEKGNMLKVDRFGYVRRAMHGTRRLSKTERDTEYGRLTIDLRDTRWAFLNTLFSVSEGCLYAQLVDRLDSGELLREGQPPFDYARCCTYDQLYVAVSKALFKAHVQASESAVPE